MDDFFPSKNPAVIIRVSHTNDVTVSPEFPAVAAANHGLAAHVGRTDGIVVLEKGLNDYDGGTAKTLEKVGNTRIWGETEYEVLPTSVLK